MYVILTVIFMIVTAISWFFIALMVVKIDSLKEKEEWGTMSEHLLEEKLEQEEYMNMLNTKALNYIADKYPGLVNEAFQNIDREVEGNV